MTLDLNQDTLLQPIHHYLKSRQRIDVANQLKGMCNGASLLLLVNCYEAIDAYYTKVHPTSTLREEITKVIDEFFKRLETLNTLVIEDPKDPVVVKKHKIRDSLAWHDAQQKLNLAIDKNTMDFSDLDVSKPRYLELLRLAANQAILNATEVTVLSEAYIPDLLFMEEFLHEIMLLQFSSNYLFNIPQNDLPHIFPYLYQQTTRDESAPLKIQAPIIEGEYDLVLTPLELLERASNLIPSNRIARISLPEHAICALRIENNIQFFDINSKERLPFDNVPELIVCILAKHDILLKRLELKKDLLTNFDKIMKLDEQLRHLTLLEKAIIAEKNPMMRVQLVQNNLNLIPEYLGLSVTIFKHPDQPRLDKAIDLQLNISQQMLNRADNRGETGLWKACLNGHYEVVKTILAKGISPNTKRNDGATAFYAAAQNGHLAILKLLKMHGVDINVENDDGKTALYTAVQHNNMIIAAWLLDNHADVNLGCKNDNQTVTTPLEIASHLGFVDMVKLLISYQTANLKPIANALFSACQGGHSKIVEILLTTGIDINVKNTDNVTPLMYATNFSQLDVIKILIHLQANHSLVDNDGNTALHIAVMSDNLAALKLLLQLGADVTICDDQGNNALHIACQYGKTAITEFLLPMLDSAKLNKQGLTPLMFASYCGFDEIVNVLCRISPKLINLNTAFGTALHLAVQEGHRQVVKTLCSFPETDINLLNNDKKSPLDIAIEKGHAEIVFDLLKRGACCAIFPKPFKLNDSNSTKIVNGLKIISMKLSFEQELMNDCMQIFVSAFIKGHTQAEKIGWLFNEICYSKNFGLFDQVTSINVEARIIRDTLLDPQRKNWQETEINAFLQANIPLKADDYFEIALLFTEKILLDKPIETLSTTHQMQRIFNV